MLTILVQLMIKGKSKATISWPFYSGGSKRAKINKNTNLKTRKILLFEDAVKTTEKNVGSASKE